MVRYHNKIYLDIVLKLCVVVGFLPTAICDNYIFQFLNGFKIDFAGIFFKNVNLRIFRTKVDVNPEITI